MKTASLQLEWGPDGEKILTATTAPRLRIGNGFKVWHYSGALLHETAWPTGQELLQVIWQKYDDGLFKEKPISSAKVQGIEPSQPQASKAVYVPPNIRSGGSAPVTPRTVNSMTSRSVQQPSERGPIPGLPVGYKVSQGQRKKERSAKRKDTDNVITRQSANSNTNLTVNSNEEGSQAQDQSTASSNNKRNQRRSPRQPNQNHINGNGTTNHNSTDASTNANTNANVNVSASNEHSSPEAGDTQNQDKSKRERKPRNRQRKPDGSAIDPEKDKRIRTVQQKLKDISKLKVRRENGENLEVNQLSKIKMEGELVKELSALRVEA